MKISSIRSISIIISLLWVIWGTVHMLAGISLLDLLGRNELAAAFASILDKLEPETFEVEYPKAVSAVFSQHAFNLLWFGLLTLIGAYFIFRGSVTALWVNALIGGLADTGYFLFIDLGNYNHFIPGTVMTIVSYSAILLTGYLYIISKNFMSLKQY